MMMMMIKLKKSLKKKIDFDVTPIFPPKTEKKKIKMIIPFFYQFFKCGK